MLDELSIYIMGNDEMHIPDQYAKIWGTDWKYLIILDACRYDYFEKVYKEYLSGKLEKVRSCGSMTAEWLECTFKGRKCDDIVYISANAYINSKGVPFREFDPKVLHFYRVVDVWDWGWDGNLQAVHPKEVNKATLVAKKLYPSKRLIIHYAQPHYPYLSLVTKGIKVKRYTVLE